MGRKKGEKPTVRGSVATKADKVGAVAGQAAAQTNIETTLKEMGIISITRTVKKKKQATIITVPAIAQDRETKQILEERYGDFLAKKGQKYTKLTIASLLHEFNIKINGAKSIVNGVVRGSALSRNHEEINLLFKLILSSSSVNLAAEQSHGIMRNLALYLQDPLFTQIPINTLINGYLKLLMLTVTLKLHVVVFYSHYKAQELIPKELFQLHHGPNLMVYAHLITSFHWVHRRSFLLVLHHNSLV